MLAGVVTHGDDREPRGNRFGRLVEFQFAGDKRVATRSGYLPDEVTATAADDPHAARVTVSVSNKLHMCCPETIRDEPRDRLNAHAVRRTA